MTEEVGTLLNRAKELVVIEDTRVRIHLLPIGAEEREK